MPDTPTFGRYAEIPVEQMTAEQQAGTSSALASGSLTGEEFLTNPGSIRPRSMSGGGSGLS